ncbi:MAG: DUF6491 family protein [Pseudomonadales bacterium]|nr:DUF6491 family protein [Pseudomonadales bacterium]
MPFAKTALTVIILVFTLLGCVAKPVAIDEKYIFTQFESVKRFSKFTVDSWQVIDNRSLIIQTSPNRYYLLILDRKLNDLKFAEVIQLTSTGGSIHAKFDCVKVKTSNCHSEPMAATIKVIYQLNGREDVITVKQQIRGGS